MLSQGVRRWVQLTDNAMESGKMGFSSRIMPWGAIIRELTLAKFYY
jgi:hypothetical protein